MAMDVKQERHITVEDLDGIKSLSKIMFHKECWHEMMTGKDELNKLTKNAQTIMKFAKDKLGIEEEVIFE